MTLTNGVNVALKRAFTDAILRVYFFGMFVIVAGFIVTMFLPELALRKTSGTQTMAMAAGEAAGDGSGQESKDSSEEGNEGGEPEERARARQLSDTGA